MTNLSDRTAGTHDGGVTVYWRPGCPFCMNLERSLTKAGVRYERRNIWEDEAAAGFVRSVANGNETVPTVAIGSVFKVNPSGKEVLSIMAQEAPELMPEKGNKKSEQGSGPIGSTFRRILGD